MFGKKNQVADNKMDLGTSSNESNNIDLKDNEIKEKATFFVKTFVKKFEKKLSEYSEEAEPDSKTQHIGEIGTATTSTVNNSIGPGLFKLAISEFCKRIILNYSAEEHRKKAIRVHEVVQSSEVRTTLIYAALDIFQSFEEIFTNLVDDDQHSWQRGIEKLAVDAVDRAIYYIASTEEKDLSIDLITKGVIFGESKKKKLVRKFLKREVGSSESSYQVKYEETDQTLLTSQIYEGIKVARIGDDTIEYYLPNKYANDQGAQGLDHRLPFRWELKEFDEEVNPRRYELINRSDPLSSPKKQYVYILNNEKKEELARFILKKINGQDPAKRKDTKNIEEHLEKQNENGRQNSFFFGESPEFFIEREESLKELIMKLIGKSQEIEMSRMVLIHGKPGVGKSEFARYCGFSQRHYSNAWKKIVWIDASSNINLFSSFRNLAKRLGISIEDRQKQEKRIESIVEDIYKYFQDTESFFVFDDAIDYTTIKDFLPFKFSCFSNRERPFVVITSNKSWGIKELKEMSLGDFEKREAEKFIEKSLGYTGSDNDLLLQKVGYSPLDLASAVGCIKEKGLNIKEYLTKYKVTQQLKPDLFKVQDSNENLLGIFSINIDEIKGAKNIGEMV